jgi:ribonuclease P protein component
MSALPQASPDPLGTAFLPVAGIRFGITVSRRQARRAVARNTVKRVLREAARLRSDALAAALDDRRVDVLFRLKAPLPEAAASGWAQVKAQLRSEADSLLDQLLQALQAGEPMAGPPYKLRSTAPARRDGRHSLAQSTSAPAPARSSKPAGA